MRITKFLIPLFLLIAALSSCRHSQKQAINQALCLAYSNPDSAINMLNAIDRHSLPNDEKPFYALTYSISQDKSGLDVDNDSLIRIAYDYYSNYNGDSLYGRCLYYMGKYYMLADSLERAEYCLNLSVRHAVSSNDTATQCLALDRLSKIIRRKDAFIGKDYSNKVLEIYQQYSRKSIHNTIYYLLDKCDCLMLCGDSKEALHCGAKALTLAFSTKDSVIISDVYQDMALFSEEMKQFELAYYYAYCSFKFSKNKNVSKCIAFASALEKTGRYDMCINLLDTTNITDALSCYTAFDIRQRIAIKNKQDKKAISYTDSIDKYVNVMYQEAIDGKNSYFKTLMKEKILKIESEKKYTFYRACFVFIIIICILIILVFIFSYKNYRNKAKNKIAIEKHKLQLSSKLYEKDMELKEKMHKEEIRHKEIQLNSMRTFLLRKIDIVERLNSIMDDEKRFRIEFTNEDWEELQLFLDNADDNFVSRISSEYQNLNDNDIRFLMLIRLRLSTKTLSRIYGISEKSIKQKLFMFKTKVNITNEKTSLRTFVDNF